MRDWSSDVCSSDLPRHHEVLIGIGVADNGRSQRIGGVIAALEMPHDVIAATLCRLSRHDATAVTAFTDGDKMLRGAARLPSAGRHLGTARSGLAAQIGRASSRDRGGPAL